MILQAGADSSALIARVASIEAVAHEKSEIEVHHLPSDVDQIALLSASKSATRDLLEWLKVERSGQILVPARNHHCRLCGTWNRTRGIESSATQGNCGDQGRERQS
jgi:hypothetical protein